MIHENTLTQCYKYIIETLLGWFYRIITKKTKTKKQKNTTTRKRFCNLYLSVLGTNLIDDTETNSKEIALSLLFFILMLTAYKIEEIT